MGNFADAVRATKGLETALKSGLRALSKSHRAKVTCADSPKVAGSVNIDQALAHSRPHENRWDYAIGVRGSGESIVWLEVHPASSSHVDEVLAKFSWLKKWLDNEAPKLKVFDRKYVWVASGKVALPKTSQKLKRLAARGIRFAGKRLEI